MHARVVLGVGKGVSSVQECPDREKICGWWYIQLTLEQMIWRSSKIGMRMALA